MKQIHKRLTYANVMSSIAVFLILGGATAFAAQKIGSSEIKGNSITTGKLKKEAVTKAKIKKASVDASKLAAGAVTTEKIANSAVTSEKIADNAVTNGKIANGAVTGAKIAPGSIGRGSLADAGLVPRAYALANGAGEVEPGFTVGIPDATTPVTGTFCFDLPFTPVHAQATGEADGEGNDHASVTLAGTAEGLAECPDGADVEVEMWDSGGNAPTNEGFYLVVW